jgi:hypothetical protein
LGVSMTVNFDIISPIRGQRKMPSERSSADTTYACGVVFPIISKSKKAFRCPTYWQPQAYPYSGKSGLTVYN